MIPSTSSCGPSIEKISRVPSIDLFHSKYRTHLKYTFTLKKPASWSVLRSCLRFGGSASALALQLLVFKMEKKLINAIFNCAKKYYFQVLKLAYYREHRSSSVKDFKIFIDIQKIVQLFSLQTIEGGAAEPAADCGFFFYITKWRFWLRNSTFVLPKTAIMINKYRTINVLSSVADSSFNFNSVPEILLQNSEAGPVFSSSTET